MSQNIAVRGSTDINMISLGHLAIVMELIHAVTRLERNAS